MKVEQIEVLGLPLEQWTHESCTAEFGVGDDWATLYSICSEVESKGHATALLIAAKRHYEALGKRFASDVALNDRMRRILRRLNIEEYAESI